MKGETSIVSKLQRNLILGSIILIVFLSITLYLIPRFVFYKNLSIFGENMKTALQEVMEVYGKTHLSEALVMAENQAVKIIYQNLKKEVRDLKQVTEQNKIVFERYGQQLRNHVEPLLKRIEGELKSKPKLHFHLAGARSFIRTWRKPGEDIKLDDISEFRKTVVIAQRENKIVIGLEPGRDGLILRAVAPIVVNGEVLGSVESSEHFSILLENFIKGHPEIRNFYVMLDKDLESIMNFYIKEGKAKVTEKGIIYMKSEKLEESKILQLADMALKNLEKDIFFERNIGYIKVPLKSYAGDNIGYVILGIDVSSQLSLFKTSFGLLVSILALTLIVFTFILTRNLRSCMSELIKTSEVMGELSKGGGDLTFRLTVSSNDEIGRLAQSFNSFVESLTQIIKNLIEKVSSLFKESKSLSDEAETLEQVANDFIKKADAISASSKEILISMEEVTKAMQELSNAITEIATRAQESASVVKKTVATVDVAKKKVEFLSKASSEIDEVVNFINSIAEQTNLLALNATIEAARAGVAGKGFAVVANEVKELANETQKATKNVAEKVRLLQESSFEVSEGVDAVVRLIKNVEDASASIASAVEEQTIVVNNVSNHIVRVKDKVMINEEQVKAIRISTENFQALAKKLKLVSLRVREVAQEIKVITDQFKI